MPAIHLPRLRKQVNDLAPYCSEPAIFLRKLKDLFDFYGDRTLRPSQAAAKPTAIPTIKVPPPVLRQIVSALTPYAASTPHLILDLSRELWDYGWLEHRLLACHLLGRLPSSQAVGIVQLADDWCRENHEEELITAIAERGLAPLHSEHQDLLIVKAHEWIAVPEKPGERGSLPTAVGINYQKLGLRALTALIENPLYENLPKIYNTLKDTLKAPPKTLRPDLLDLVRVLAQRSPQETAFYLRSLYTENPSSALAWLIRRSLNSFPDETQRRLRALINPPKPL
jgi:hypothetical protein